MSTTNPINRTTEWDDLQIKYGNYAPMEKEVTQEEMSRQAQELIASVDPLEKKSLRELEELEDDVDEDVLEVYRRRRLEELKKKTAQARFNGVYDVTMDNYVDEVTLASKDATVILHLYDDNVPACVFINRAFEAIATKHRDIKFCKGIAARVLQNFKTGNLPTVLVYKGTKCVHQLMGMSIFTDNVKNLTPELVEFVLGRKFKLFETDVEDQTDDTKTRLRKYLHNSDDEDDEAEVSADALHTAAYDRGYSNLDLDSVMNLVRK